MLAEPYLSEHTFESDIARAATLCRGDDEHLLRIWGWLDNGADIDEAGGDAWDGEELCVLSRCEHPYLAKFLLERGADVNLADRYGATPLYHACSNPNEPWGTEMMNALLDAGADVDAKTTVSLQRVAIAGETALSTSLDWFRREREHRKLGLSYVSLLLRRGASLDDCWGGMPVEECLRHIETPDAFGDDINEIYDPRGDASDASDVASRATDKDFIACKKMLADERRRRYLLPRKEILRLRSLVVRGRAKKSSDAMIEPSFRLPDGVLWNVLSFWPPQRPKTFWRARAYDGPRPGCVFTTRGGRTGYWLDAEPQVEYHGLLYRETEVAGVPDGQTLSGALAPGYRGPGWLPGNPNWLSPNFWLRGGHD